MPVLVNPSNGIDHRLVVENREGGDIAIYTVGEEEQSGPIFFHAAGTGGGVHPLTLNALRFVSRCIVWDTPKVVKLFTDNQRRGLVVENMKHHGFPAEPEFIPEFVISDGVKVVSFGESGSQSLLSLEKQNGKFQIATLDFVLNEEGVQLTGSKPISIEPVYPLTSKAVAMLMTAMLQEQRVPLDFFNALEKSPEIAERFGFQLGEKSSRFKFSMPDAIPGTIIIDRGSKTCIRQNDKEFVF